MNPILILIVLIIAFLIWLTFSFLYQPIGRFFKRLIDDAKEAMQDESEDKNEG